MVASGQKLSQFLKKSIPEIAAAHRAPRSAGIGKGSDLRLESRKNPSQVPAPKTDNDLASLRQESSTKSNHSMKPSNQ